MERFLKQAETLWADRPVAALTESLAVARRAVLPSALRRRVALGIVDEWEVANAHLRQAAEKCSNWWAAHPEFRVLRPGVEPTFPPWHPCVLDGTFFCQRTKDAMVQAMKSKLDGQHVERGRRGATAGDQTKVRVKLDLDLVQPERRERAQREFEAGDWYRFLISLPQQEALDLVFKNSTALLERGIYEDALLAAFTDCPLNNHSYRVSELALLFEQADRQRLRAAGDPLPGPGPFTVYRGVAGVGRNRRVRGYSWTALFERAKWFAKRPPGFGNPEVYEVKAPEEWVLAYTKQRKEEEFLLRLPRGAKVTRIWPARQAAGR